MMLRSQQCCSSHACGSLPKPVVGSYSFLLEVGCGHMSCFGQWIETRSSASLLAGGSESPHAIYHTLSNHGSHKIEPQAVWALEWGRHEPDRPPPIPQPTTSADPRWSRMWSIVNLAAVLLPPCYGRPLGNVTLLLPLPLEPAQPCGLLWPMGY